MPPLHKWLRLPTGRRNLAVKVTLLLAIIRVGLVLAPFKLLRRWSARLSARWPSRQGVDAAYLADLQWAVKRAGRYIVPDRPCLTEALAVQFLLRRRGYPAELCIGVMKDAAGRLVAHAWVESEGSVIIGGPESALAGYTRLPSLDAVSLGMG